MLPRAGLLALILAVTGMQGARAACDPNETCATCILQTPMGGCIKRGNDPTCEAPEGSLSGRLRWIGSADARASAIIAVLRPVQGEARLRLPTAADIPPPSTRQFSAIRLRGNEGSGEVVLDARIRFARIFSDVFGEGDRFPKCQKVSEDLSHRFMGSIHIFDNILRRIPVSHIARGRQRAIWRRLSATGCQRMGLPADSGFLLRTRPCHSYRRCRCVHVEAAGKGQTCSVSGTTYHHEPAMKSARAILWI